MSVCIRPVVCKLPSAMAHRSNQAHPSVSPESKLSQIANYGCAALLSVAGLWLLSACGGGQLSDQERERVAQRTADIVVERMRGGEHQAAAAVPAGAPEDPYRGDRVQVKLDDAPSRGAADALVTVVVFSDFECPFCSRVVPTLEQLMDAHGENLRLVFRHNPLPFHTHAKPAATVAVEAFRQGGNAAFWAMHDRLFANQRQLGDSDLVSHGRALGLDTTRLQQALQNDGHADAIARDQAYAANLGARGTPSFFINGRSLRGAQPFAAFDAMVREEVAYAQQLVAGGLSRADVYQTLMAAAPETPPAAEVAPPAQPPQQARYTIPVPADAPAFGPDNASITVQMFTDFECPFCSRVQPEVERLRGAYPNVRFVFRHYPLPMHTNAPLAHEAAVEVFVQGGADKFWAFHDLLFENQRALQAADLERYAGEVGGVSLRRFRQALTDRRHRARVQQDIDAIQDAGARIGTPSFFINDLLIQGAQPYERFAEAIDAAE